jgi:hypothetical protein
MWVARWYLSLYHFTASTLCSHILVWCGEQRDVSHGGLTEKIYCYSSFENTLLWVVVLLCSSAYYRSLDQWRRKWSVGTCWDMVMVCPAWAGENLDFGVGLRLKNILRKRSMYLDSAAAEFLHLMALIFWGWLSMFPKMLLFTGLLLLLLFTAIGFSPGGSSPYTSTHNTNGHIIYIKVIIQNKLYTITKQNRYSKTIPSAKVSYVPWQRQWSRPSYTIP